MPDEWKWWRFNPNDFSDNSQDADNDGYTNLEEYLNGTYPQHSGNLKTPPNRPTGLTAIR
jgi:hypothetical protein